MPTSDEGVDEWVERARRAWPALTCDEAEFRADCQAASAEGTVFYGEDRWLALACEGGQPQALRALERLLAPMLEQLVLRSRGSRIEAADLRQLVWQRLLVAAPPDEPKLREYKGRGALKAWLRVIATRLLVDVSRKQSGNESPISEERATDALVATTSDPELMFLKHHAHGHLVQAVTQALAALGPDERTLLRQHLVDNLSIDQLAVAHGIHRATAARWIQSAKASLLSDARKRLISRMGISGGELESVMRMIESQLHVSIGRLLVEPG